ncbi:hypothetical protein KIPB_000874 [Kipferlia bialata]|uniref:EXS domain-containing protein n=1 Tax=Kipferlia bialata TaxID=797122 RepID=A0A9K3GEV2_9EUKA|nr:hypothetical protein KIPB_000874 [Kipferlia bialata]|eukprot:g874.t1
MSDRKSVPLRPSHFGGLPPIPDATGLQAPNTPVTASPCPSSGSEYSPSPVMSAPMHRRAMRSNPHAPSIGGGPGFPTRESIRGRGKKAWASVSSRRVRAYYQVLKHYMYVLEASRFSCLTKLDEEREREESQIEGALNERVEQMATEWQSRDSTVDSRALIQDLEACVEIECNRVNTFFESRLQVLEAQFAKLQEGITAQMPKKNLKQGFLQLAYDIQRHQEFSHLNYAGFAKVLADIGQVVAKPRRCALCANTRVYPAAVSVSPSEVGGTPSAASRFVTYHHSPVQIPSSEPSDSGVSSDMQVDHRKEAGLGAEGSGECVCRGDQDYVSSRLGREGEREREGGKGPHLMTFLGNMLSHSGDGSYVPLALESEGHSPEPSQTSQYDSESQFLTRLNNPIKEGSVLNPEVLAEQQFACSPAFARLDSNLQMLFTSYFRANRAILLQVRQNRLRWSAKDSFKIGLVLGLVLPISLVVAFVLAVPIAGMSDNIVSVPGFTTAAIPFRGLGLIILGLFGVALDVHIFAKEEINHVFVMELHPKRTLTHVQLSKMAGMLSVVYLSCLAAFGIALLLKAINTQFREPWPVGYPVLVLFASFLVLFTVPLHVFHSGARLSFWKVCAKWATLPFSRVRFFDFFVTETLTSYQQSLSDITWSVCEIVKGTYTDPFYGPTTHPSDACIGISRWSTSLVVMLPALFRLLQGMSLLAKTKRCFPHLASMGKYTLLLLAGVCFLLFETQGAPVYYYLWLFARSAASMYCYLWDMTDCGLLCASPDAKGTLLHRKWVYPVYMLLDLVLRFSWLLKVARRSWAAFHPEVVNTVVAVVEICRRVIWSVFRIEYETRANWADFRADAFVPKPLNLPDAETSETSDDDDDGHSLIPMLADTDWTPYKPANESLARTLVSALPHIHDT